MELLDNEGLSKDSKALEVGPGDGELLVELLERGFDVVAVDNSEEMLKKTKQVALIDSSENVEFKLSELESFQAKDEFNLVSMNMVLHHTSNPKKAIEKAFSLLAKDGVLLLSDLCSHSQQWARELCGDMWLGFSSEELEQWAENAGFSKGESSFIGLKNGFQIQLKTFFKNINNETSCF